LRKAVTKDKLNGLFDTVLAVETIETTVNHRMLEVDELVNWRDQVARWKDKVRNLFRTINRIFHELGLQEYSERLEINYQRELDQALKDRRQSVASEKRRWKIRFYTREGNIW
jgi:hypothetical protein